MRGIAMAQGTATGFSFGGSFTVVFLGAAAGLAAGLIYVAALKFVGNHIWLGRLLFGLVLLAITLRGLRPVDSHKLVWFLPLFVAYAVILDRLWARRSAAVPTQSTTAHAA